MKGNNNLLNQETSATLKEIFSTRLKHLRILTGLNQDELAAEVGVNRSYISRLESGKDLPSLDLAYKFARLFSCSLDHLTGMDRRRQSTLDRTVPVIDGYIVGAPIVEQNIVGTVVVPGNYKVDFGISIKHDWLTDYGIQKGDLVLIKLTKEISPKSSFVFLRTSPSAEPRLFLREKEKNRKVVFIRPRGKKVQTEPEIVSPDAPGVEILGCAISVLRLYMKERNKRTKVNK